MNCRPYLIFFFIAVSTTVKSQDIHLSQYYASPANLSPGLTGIFDGDYRFVGNQRTQWRSITNPYTFNTFGGSFDANGLFGNKKYGAGASVYNDNAGDSDFNTLQINVSGRISQRISKDSAHTLALGIQTGITQRSINYNKLRFDNQYNGQSYDPNLSNGESFSNNGINYLNLNAGISWIFDAGNAFSMTNGLAVHNINTPEQSFYNASGITLDRRLSLFSLSSYQMNGKLSLHPGISWMRQGKFNEFVYGANAKYAVSQAGNKVTLNFGAWRRTQDAGFILLGMDYNDVNVGVSYDITTSKLNPASVYKGGLEVSVIYIIRRMTLVRTKHIVCPSFV